METLASQTNETITSIVIEWLHEFADTVEGSGSNQTARAHLLKLAAEIDRRKDEGFWVS